MAFQFMGVTGMASLQSILDCQTEGNTSQRYSAYGEQRAAASGFSLPGFNGERQDPVTGVSHLGNGYRAYNTVLMRFHAPDSLSPFGKGGINPYAYCAGDPVNHTDPSGHLSGQAWAGIGMGIAGLLATVFTGGLAIAAASGVAAALAGASTTALVTGVVEGLADMASIASGATSDVNPQASSALGWASVSLGVVGLIGGVTGAIKGGISYRKHINDRKTGRDRPWEWSGESTSEETPQGSGSRSSTNGNERPRNAFSYENYHHYTTDGNSFNFSDFGQNENRNNYQNHRHAGYWGRGENGDFFNLNQSSSSGNPSRSFNDIINRSPTEVYNYILDNASNLNMRFGGELNKQQYGQLSRIIHPDKGRVPDGQAMQILNGWYHQHRC